MTIRSRTVGAAAITDTVDNILASVQTQIDNNNTYIGNRANHTGNMPASNVLMSDNSQSVEARILALEARISTASASAPILTTDPTISTGTSGVIQSKGYASTATATTHQITFTEIGVGSAGIIGFFLPTVAAVTSVVDNLGVSWTKATDLATSSYTAIYYRADCPSGVTSVTITCASSHCTIIFSERDDIATTSTVDQVAIATYASGTTFTSGNAPTTTTDDAAFGFAVQTTDGSTSLSPGAGWTNVSGTNITSGNVANTTEGHKVVGAWQVFASAGTPAFSGTMASSVSGRSAIVAFNKKAAAAVAVDATITAVSGTVTEGLGGSHTNNWQWIKIGGTPPVTENINAATTSSLKITSDLAGYRLGVSQTPVDAVIPGLVGNTKISALTSVVTATVPSNSVAPTFTPTGSQAVGTTYTASNGTWSNATGATYQYRWKVNGNPVQTGSTGTYTTVAGQEAGTLSLDVMATTSQGSSAWVAASSSSTITGSAGITFTSAPAWNGTLYFGIPNDFTEGVTTGLSPVNKQWEFLRNDPAAVTAYVSPPNTISVHTPRSPAQVGDTLYIRETVTDSNGVTYTSVSSGATVTAAPASLAASLTTTGISLSQGIQMTATTIATITGGTAPYFVSIAGLPTGISATVSGQNVVLSGTPSVAVASSSYTVVITDSASSTPVSLLFTITVIATGISALSAMPFPVPLELQPNGSQSYAGSATVTVASTVRLEKVTDTPSGRSDIYRRTILRADHNNGSNNCRNEFIWNSTGPYPNLFPGDDIVQAFAFKPRSGFWPTTTSSTDNDMAVFQTHSESNGDTQPDLAIMVDIGRNRMYFQRSWSAASQALTPQGVSVDWISAMPALDVWHKFVIRWKLGYLTSHNPRLEVYYKAGNGAWNKIIEKIASTDFNTYNWNTGSYLRIGFYKWSGTTWTSGLTSISMDQTNLYAENGAAGFDWLARGQAALAGL